MTWYYKTNPVTQDSIDPNCIGFVYLITNSIDQKKYIGQKKFQFKTRKKAKGKRSKIKYVTSDWERYYGSNKDLQEDVRKHGKEFFFREILYFCYGKAEMNYLELKEQIIRNALLLPNEYYNSYLGGRISRSQIKKMIII